MIIKVMVMIMATLITIMIIIMIIIIRIFRNYQASESLGKLTSYGHLEFNRVNLQSLPSQPSFQLGGELKV